ncbi:MAG: beta-lactamase family protein [Syntrophorhabdus sp.]|nr:beta-lactamase family protein [Syntrophorhabdus sp.]
MRSAKNLSTVGCFHFLFLACLALIVLAPVPVRCADFPYTATIAEGRTAVKEVMEQTGASSVSVAFTDGDRLVWTETFGYADRASGTLPAKETMYCIGSTSKMVATIAVMRLVDQKKVSLDAPVADYIRSFTMLSPGYRKITVRMLLNHSAGFPGTDERNAETTSPLTFDYSAQIRETLAAGRLKHDPGCMNIYCNDCFTMVEQLVEAVTGKKYAQFVHDEIFAPLGMTHSRYPLGYFPEGSFAVRYDRDGALPQLFLNTGASGGLYSTPTDVAKLAMMLAGGGITANTRILSEAAVTEMGKDQTLSTFNPVRQDGMSFGLGWDTVRQPGLRAVGVTGWQKGGDVPFYGSVMSVAPKERLAVVVLGASGRFGSGSATIVAERILLKALAETGRIASMPGPVATKPAPAKKSSGDEADSSGGYYANNSTLLKVKAGPGGSLDIVTYDAAKGSWKDWLVGVGLREDGYWSTDAAASPAVSFVKAEGRSYMVVRMAKGYGHYTDSFTYAQKVGPTSKPQAAWNEKRLGTTWLLVNEHPDFIDKWKTPVFRLRSIDGMIFADWADLQIVDASTSDARAVMTLLIPQSNGTGLNDVVIETRSGEEWVRFGSYLFRPAQGIGVLKPGDNPIAPPAGQMSEWRRYDVGDNPARVNIVPNGKDGQWKMYDGSFALIHKGAGGKSMELAAGTYYFLCHDPANIRITPAAKVVYKATIADAEAAVNEVLKKTGASSLAMALVDGDRLVWTEAFGLADRESKTVPKKETLYAIGSTSKMFATVAVMKLVDRGLISLDEPVVKHLKSFRMLSPEYRQITVRMLLNHSSGFPGTDYRNGFTTTPFKDYSAQVLETLATLRLKHPPGYLSVYCNDGFTVVEQLIASVTGKSYPRFVEDEILKPLGMKNSRYMLDYPPEGSTAKRYDGKGRELPFMFVNVLASGGLYSTPSDMARFAMMLIGKGRLGDTRILSEKAVAEMAKDQTLGSFNPVRSNMVSYGLGWDTVRQPGLGAVGVTAWQKGGAIPYMKALFTVVPDERLAAFVVGASGNFGSDDTIVLMERLLLNALVEKGRIASVPSPLKGKALPEKTVSPAELRSFAGCYGRSDSLLRVSRGRGQSLSIYRYDPEKKRWGAWQKGLTMRSDGYFASKADPLQAFAFRTADGRQYLINHSVAGYGHYRDSEVIGQKVPSAAALPASWKKRLARHWLISNDNPTSDEWEAPVADLANYRGLLLSSGSQVVDPTLSDSRAGMVLVIPQLKGRDLNDLVIENRAGDEWLRLGSYLYRPRETVQKLARGETTIVLGPDGNSEWRVIDRLNKAKTLTISPDRPDGSWRLYDARLKQLERGKGKKSLPLAGGTYYLLFHDNARVIF